MAGFLSVFKSIFTLIQLVPSIVSILNQIVKGAQSVIEYTKDKVRVAKANEAIEEAKSKKDTSKLEGVY